MQSDDKQKAIIALQDRVTDLMFRVLALQTLLQERGLISADEIDQRSQSLRDLWQKRLDGHLSDQKEEAKIEQLRRLLESHESTKQ